MRSTIIALLALAGRSSTGTPTPVPVVIPRCEELHKTAWATTQRGGRRRDHAGRVARDGQGDFDEARQLAEEGRVVYEELGLRYMRAARSR